MNFIQVREDDLNQSFINDIWINLQDSLFVAALDKDKDAMENFSVLKDVILDKMSCRMKKYLEEMSVTVFVEKFLVESQNGVNSRITE